MAAKTNTEEMVTIRLRKIPDPHANQTEFFSYNYKNYRIKRGEEVQIPAGLAEIIRNGELAEDAAFDFAQSKALREPKNDII